MTPKEKAIELVEKFREFAHAHYFERNGTFDEIGETINAKQCALIAVAEIMYNNIIECPQHNVIYVTHKNDYWKEVKQEIEKL